MLYATDCTAGAIPTGVVSLLHTGITSYFALPSQCSDKTLVVLHILLKAQLH